MLKLFKKHDKSDSFKFGIIRNIFIAIITILIEIILISIFFLKFKENRAVAMFFYVIAIPVGFLISGIYNGISLVKEGFSKSAKMNFIIAFMFFLFLWIFTTLLFRH